MNAIAVVGTGYYGKSLVRNFHQLGILKTVCDASPPIRKQMSDTYPAVTGTDDIDAVLNDEDIQGLVIASPAVTHYDLAREALNAGKQVFVE